jgi:SH3-like domain-containing protein
MEALAFTHSYITYENPDSDLKLRSFDELGLKIPSSAWIGLAGLAVAVSVMSVPAEAHAAYVSTNGSRLNIRCGPGLEYCVGGKLHNGSKVRITHKYKYRDGIKWVKLKSGGWVAAHWLGYGHKVASSCGYRGCKPCAW